MIDTIMQSGETVSLVCIGPVPNIPLALEREPKIVEKARFTGMHGAIYKGYGGSEPADKEYNVVHDVPACQAALSAAWDITITPLDTCGLVTLKGENYQRVKDSNDTVLKALMENYQVWLDAAEGQPNLDLIKTQSSTLFDTVAIYLALTEDLCVMNDLKITVDEEGKTLVDENGKPMHVATDWKDLDAFYAWLTSRLTAMP